MSYLLDTHVLLWLLTDPSRVPADARELLADRRTSLVVSGVSALEVSTKVRLGKLHAPGLVAGWDHHTRRLSADALPIAPSHALLAGSLDWEHRDPFDRLLAAQSIIEQVTLVTVDPALTSLPTLRTLHW